MKFLELAKKRYSVRNYQEKKVEQEKLALILEAGRIAPTAVNKQPNHFLVIQQAAGLEKLAKGVNAHGAPLAVIVCTDKDTAWTRPFDNHSMTDIDASIAADQMMMCAEDLGLATCWLTYFQPEIIRQEFNIPSNLVPVNILAIGYSADETPQSPDRHNKTRKPLDSLVSYESF